MSLLLRIVLISSISINTGKTVLVQSPHPVWQPIDSSIGKEYVEVTGSFILQNPCQFLLPHLHKDLAAEAVATCNLYYRHSIIDELSLWCPPRVKSHVRVSREIISMAILVFATIVSAGLGGTALYYTYENSESIKSLQDSLSVTEQMLADVEKQVIESDKRIREISSHFNTMAKQLLAHQDDFDMVKRTLIGTTFGISKLISQLTLGQRIITESRYMWERKKVNPHFLSFFNVTIPFGKDIPLELAVPISCEMKYDQSLLQLKFRAPKLNNELRLLKAESFDVMVANNSHVCTGIYTGPKTAVISTNDSCIVALNPNQNCPEPDTLLQCRPD